MLATRSFLFPFIISLVFSHGLRQIQTQSPSFTTVKYHGGALLTGRSGINVYLILYGGFSSVEVTSITDFFASFSSNDNPEPNVSTWWRTIGSYTDRTGNPVSRTVRLVRQVGDVYSIGKNLNRGQIRDLVRNRMYSRELPVDFNGIYLVLTANDVTVEQFCMGSCGFHDTFEVARRRLVYAHVGDPSSQCPGLCAWPFAVPAYGPPGEALVPPNGAGADGMIMNIATVLAGAATNPYNTGYFQGDALAPLEAVTACPGVFGPGAYPGYPGDLLVDRNSRASYNVYGANGEKFLLPAIWDLRSSACKVVA